MTKRNKKNVPAVQLVPVLCQHSEAEVCCKSQEQHKAIGISRKTGRVMF